MSQDTIIGVADEVVDSPLSESTEIAITSFDQFGDALEKLHALASQPFDFTTKEGLAQARKVRSMCTAARQAVDEAYTVWNAPRLQEAKEARDMRDFFKFAVSTFEAPLDARITEDARLKKEAKEKRDREEAERVQGHRSEMAKLARLPDLFISRSSEEIAMQLEELRLPEYLSYRQWDEYAESDEGGTSPVAGTLATVISTMEAHLANAKAREQLAELQRKQEADAAARKAEDEFRELERKHTDALLARIRSIELTPSTCVGMDSKFIAGQIKILQGTETSSFVEFEADAVSAISSALDALKEMESAAIQKEEDDAELAQLRAEKAARKAKEEKEAADRLASEQAAEAERQAQARAEEEARIKAERAAQIARETAERERAEAAEEARKLVEKNATRLLEQLRTVVAYAREAGNDWMCLAEADALINEVAPATEAVEA